MPRSISACSVYGGTPFVQMWYWYSMHHINHSLSCRSYLLSIPAFLPGKFSLFHGFCSIVVNIVASVCSLCAVASLISVSAPACASSLFPMHAVPVRLYRHADQGATSWRALRNTSMSEAHTSLDRRCWKHLPLYCIFLLHRSL